MIGAMIVIFAMGFGTAADELTHTPGVGAMAFVLAILGGHLFARWLDRRSPPPS